MNFYFEAAKVLDRLDSKLGSINSIIATLPQKDRKRTAALVIETLKFKPVLGQVIETVQLLKERKLTSRNLVLVLVHDLLLSRGIQAGDGPIKQAVLRHKTRLHGEFQKIKIKRGALSNEQLAISGDERAALIPRYVRVNTCLGSFEDAVQSFISRGFLLTDTVTSDRCFMKDEHVPNVLLFPSNTSFKEDPLYLAGKIILQDKASCFPALVVDPPAMEGSVVIDATAAPGNKTSHLSALMMNKGVIYAFERDQKRFATLKMMLAKAGCSNVTTLNSDFLLSDPLNPKFAPVSHILLDPSCSGSGIVNRLDHLLEDDKEVDSLRDDRLNKLAAFQLLMIKHAMRFPNVKKIVYSTCSIHATENEGVVRSALASEECLNGKFRLAPRSSVLPTWPRRGDPEAFGSLEAESLVRCAPGEDRTNGFFVSCFIKAAEVNDERKVASKKKKRKVSKRGTT